VSFFPHFCRCCGAGLAGLALAVLVGEKPANPCEGGPFCRR
jgi:hypothetical protein